MLRLFSIISVTWALVFPTFTNAKDLSKSLAPMMAARDAIAANFVATIETCVARTDTDHILFRGCIDWHSSAHGNWALFAYSNAKPNYSHSIDPDLFAEEMAFLQAYPGFEFPYGRAWLMRLAIDADTAQAGVDWPAQVDPIFDDMLDYYGAVQFEPFSTSYRSASWALINMHDYAEHFGKSAQLMQIKEIISRVYGTGDTASCNYDWALGSFMAVCTNWAMLMARVLDQAAYDRWLDNFIATNGLPKPIKHARNAHELGLNFSRAWGLWDMYAKSGKPRENVARAYARVFLTSYNTPENWSGDYRVSAHWVSQFGMFALQPLLGGRK